MQIVYTDRHQLHTTDQAHLEGYPLAMDEVPARAEIILKAVQAAQLGPVITPTDHGLNPILAIHAADLVDFLQHAYNESAKYKKACRVFPDTFATRHRGRKPHGFLGLKGYYAFDPYSPILAGTWAAAYWSAQCALSGADFIRAGERVAYALCRPPGHHAAADLYGGYCYLNNAAIAARYLQTVNPLAVAGSSAAGPHQAGRLRSQRSHREASHSTVAILDIDYHHGNGTQAIFYKDPAVLFCSLHAHPEDEYPYYWGTADEIGQGAGKGYNRNWPLPLGTDDESYLSTLDQALATIEAFAPQYLLVSAGFDIFAGDPVGGFNITTAGLYEIGLRIAALNLPTLIVQEGGYLQKKLAENALAFLKAFV